MKEVPEKLAGRCPRCGPGAALVRAFDGLEAYYACAACQTPSRRGPQAHDAQSLPESDQAELREQVARLIDGVETICGDDGKPLTRVDAILALISQQLLDANLRASVCYEALRNAGAALQYVCQFAKHDFDGAEIGGLRCYLDQVNSALQACEGKSLPIKGSDDV